MHEGKFCEQNVNLKSYPIIGRLPACREESLCASENSLEELIKYDRTGTMQFFNISDIYATHEFSDRLVIGQN